MPVTNVKCIFADMSYTKTNNAPWSRNIFTHKATKRRLFVDALRYAIEGDTGIGGVSVRQSVRPTIRYTLVLSQN